MPKPSNFANTYSIIAADRTAGFIGGAVQSHYFSVGSVVLWGESGTGMVATQSLVNPAFGPEGLELLRGGTVPEEAVRKMRRSDYGIEHRQFALIDTAGRAAAFTGGKCIPYAGHVNTGCGNKDSAQNTGLSFSAQANMMLNPGVPEAMAAAFSDASGSGAERWQFAGRLIAALEAAEKTGGDIRGRQSAHIMVLPLIQSAEPWREKLMDLRVEDHPEPVKELGRLVRIDRAYEYSDAGDKAMERGEVDEALAAFSRAEELHPDEIELVYWHAVALADAGRTEEARPLFDRVYSTDPNWRELTRRLPEAGLISFDPADVDES